jgi:hypothetical protein
MLPFGQHRKSPIPQKQPFSVYFWGLEMNIISRTVKDSSDAKFIKHLAL